MPSYPFISRNQGDISRYSILSKFITTMKIKGSDTPKEWWENPIRIDIKQYEYGYLSKNHIGAEVEDYTGIFRASNKILKREEEGYYPYRIDGLIYLPVYYSVKGTTEGVQPRYINGTWDSNFKWKPPEENTIDFLVKVKKIVVDAEVRDQVVPYVTSTNGINTINNFKQLELYVGYDESKDDSINYCMRVMEDIHNNSEEKIKRFNHSLEGDNKYDLTNIPLEDGKMLCMNYEKDEIHDGDLVEMRFNPDAEDGCYWEPLRIRVDKIDPQFFTIAMNVWNTIQDPITSDMIKGNYNINEIVKETEEDNGK